MTPDLVSVPAVARGRPWVTTRDARGGTPRSGLEAQAHRLVTVLGLAGACVALAISGLALGLRGPGPIDEPELAVSAALVLLVGALLLALWRWRRQDTRQR